MVMMGDLFCVWLTIVLLILSCANCQQTYDFIVVGAGTGGSAIARRLVENGRHKVLLVEAGGAPKEGYDVPARVPKFLMDPDMTYNFPTLPHKTAALLDKGIVRILAGRMLGGTSALNYMWFNRGSPRDWDNWAEVTGDQSWKYENMLEYFKRSEDYQGDFNSDEHATGGPITVSNPHYSPGLEFWLRAGQELGYTVGGPNGPQRPGFSTIEFSKRRGRRVSSFDGYIGPVQNNSNLHILTNTDVSQVIIRGNRATGIRFTSNSNRSSSAGEIAYASKEVILSAGGYFSSVILQRSGIGPRRVLQAANIPVVKDLPTGHNLQGHASIIVNFAINNDSAVMHESRDLTPENWQLFNNVGDGPFSSTRGASGQALIASSVAKAEGQGDWPDLHLCMSHNTLPYFGYDPLLAEARANLSRGEVPISAPIFLGRPKSRGTVRVNPDNVLKTPLVDAAFLTDDRDLQSFVDGIQETLRIFEQTSAYAALGARLVPVTPPGCVGLPVRSKEHWQCYVRQITAGGCHPAGTNKMGKVTDPTAVVDSTLRVIGIDGLRVVDASIMPSIVNANPQAAVYAIAEKAAELILNRWQSPIREFRGSPIGYPFNRRRLNNNYRHWSDYRFRSRLS